MVSNQVFSGGCAGKCSSDLVEEVIEICHSYGHKIEWGDCNTIPSVGGELIQSVDIINQIVPDPRAFGKIAAAHSCSDIYVAGGEPFVCNMILGVPRENSRSIVMESVRGAAEFMANNGVQIRGGHTIYSASLQMGFSVIGKRSDLPLKQPLCDGDVLILTKKIGTGLMANSLHSGEEINAVVDELYDVLIESNSVGALLCKQQGVKVMTDITGFGLAFGIRQLCNSQGVSATVWLENIPVFTDWERYAIEGYYPSLAYKNKKNLCFEKDNNIAEWRELLVYDPQTNGSILSIVSPDSIPELTKILKENASQLYVIGEIGGDSFQLKMSENDE